MKFLFDQSADFRLIPHLSNLGHDVKAISRDYPHSLADEDVLAISRKEQRILIVADRDFGELIFEQGLAHSGVIFFRLPGASLQAKIEHLNTARVSVPQPAADAKSTRAALLYNGGVRSQNQAEANQRSGRITIWGIDQTLKAELERIAARDGISLSAVGLALIRRAIRQDIDLEYSATLEPMFERILTRYLSNRDSRIISLLVRIAFDSGQTRSIVTNILGLQPDVSPELLRDIIAESDKRAKSNIMRRSPQMTELIEALEKWFFETHREGKESQPH